MTPNDVVNPEADVLYLTGDDADESVREYLCTEGYQVATTTDQLLEILRQR
jgi:rRNA-processing protein FCF1